MFELFLWLKIHLQQAEQGMLKHTIILPQIFFEEVYINIILVRSTENWWFTKNISTEVYIVHTPTYLQSSGDFIWSIHWREIKYGEIMKAHNWVKVFYKS